MSSGSSVCSSARLFCHGSFRLASTRQFSVSFARASSTNSVGFKKKTALFAPEILALVRDLPLRHFAELEWDPVDRPG